MLNLIFAYLKLQIYLLYFDNMQIINAKINLLIKIKQKISLNSKIILI